MCQPISCHNVQVIMEFTNPSYWQRGTTTDVTDVVFKQEMFVKLNS